MCKQIFRLARYGAKFQITGIRFSLIRKNRIYSYAKHRVSPELLLLQPIRILYEHLRFTYRKILYSLSN